eukprot:6214357-Pleurochrysis_carterae.AAC.8
MKSKLQLAQTAVLTHRTLDSSTFGKGEGANSEVRVRLKEGKTTEKKRDVAASECPGALPVGPCGISHTYGTIIPFLTSKMEYEICKDTKYRSCSLSPRRRPYCNCELVARCPASQNSFMVLDIDVNKPGWAAGCEHLLTCLPG